MRLRTTPGAAAQNFASPRKYKRIAEETKEKQKTMAKERGFSIQRDLLAGEWLTRGSVVKHIRFLIFVVVLVILYMSMNQAIIDVNRRKNKNNIEIKNLKADYTSKAAILQNQSSRNKIIEKLKMNGSSLKNPTAPAQKIEMKVE